MVYVSSCYSCNLEFNRYSEFLKHIAISDEVLQTMPEHQRPLFEPFPILPLLAFGISVFVGFSGSIALILKNKIARWLFITSLVGTLVQRNHSYRVASVMGDSGLWV